MTSIPFQKKISTPWFSCTNAVARLSIRTAGLLNCYFNHFSLEFRSLVVTSVEDLHSFNHIFLNEHHHQRVVAHVTWGSLMHSDLGRPQAYTVFSSNKKKEWVSRQVRQEETFATTKDASLEEQKQNRKTPNQLIDTLIMQNINSSNCDIFIHLNVAVKNELFFILGSFWRNG